MTGAWWPEPDFPSFTLVAESDIQFASVPNHDRPLTLRKGESVTFTSADHLYIRTLRDEAEERP